MELNTENVASYINNAAKNVYLRELMDEFSADKLEILRVLSVIVKDRIVFTPATTNRYWSSWEHRKIHCDELNAKQRVRKQQAAAAVKQAIAESAGKKPREFKVLAPTPKWLLERLAETGGVKAYIGVFDDPDRIRASMYIARKDRR